MVKNKTAKDKKSTKNKIHNVWFFDLAKKHTKQLTRQYLECVYALGSLLLLAGTTVYWSILGAQIQWTNADQTVNTYLLENGHTFHDALLPGQHTFLIKWPLFWLIHSFGASQRTFAVWTVLTVLLTVGLFAFLLYRIEKRKIIIGTVFLAMASVLLLVPAEPYAGGILPVNMAMVTTRNLEYIIYLAALALCVKSASIRDWRLWLSVILLSLLVASDKLFMSLGLGGAIIVILVYAIARRKEMLKAAAKWLGVNVLAIAGASLTLAAVQSMHITQIAVQNGAGPYNVVRDVSQIILGGVYAVLAVITNFGANPASDVRILRDVPSEAISTITTWGGLAFLVNIALLGLAVWAAFVCINASFYKQKTLQNLPAPQPARVTFMVLLISSCLAAAAVFTISDHYYPVDARYLAIWFFGLFVVATVYLNQRAWPRKNTYIVAAILVCGIGLGMIASYQSYNQERLALSAITKRNSIVATSLKYHPVKTLVGDYWRVLPIKSATGNKQQVTPLESCTQARDILSSKNWQPNLRNRSFAYLLTTETSPTGYKPCSLKQITDAYGQPSSITLISGQTSQPKEILLFYDHGAHKQDAKPVPEVPSTEAAQPETFDQLPTATCAGRTILNVVAHQDDDLLFMNPDTLHSLQSGDCVRTVYVTAGDAGQDKLYWLGRERGSKAAYEVMLGTQNEIWVDRISKVAANQYVTVSSVGDNPRASLLFMRLPDGSVRGEGFASSGYQSLALLRQGQIGSIDTKDGQSSYNAEQLTNALTTIMDYYQPAEVRTQTPINMSPRYPDHSDHLAVGAFTSDAFMRYQNKGSTNPVYYAGYPVRAWDENVGGADLDAKQAIFFAYSHFDGSVCTSIESCDDTAYHFYLPRQYSQTPQ